ncbi:MAG: hypothetical protein JWM95_4605 [Gemmatimonadetes bacterium]|nr:hypothetical protein [Gemmatimonadota bacterium]
MMSDVEWGAERRSGVERRKDRTSDDPLVVFDDRRRDDIETLADIADSAAEKTEDDSPDRGTDE